jgi:tRNA(Ile)-lysidine synthase
LISLAGGRIHIAPAPARRSKGRTRADQGGS